MSEVTHRVRVEVVKFPLILYVMVFSPKQVNNIDGISGLIGMAKVALGI